MSNVQTQQFALTGMTCQACANRIEKVLNKKSAIVSAEVNFASETAVVSFDGEKTNTNEIITWIKKTGFDASPLVENTPQKTSLPWKLMVLWLLCTPFFVGMIGMMAEMHTLMPPVWLQFILATLVQFVLGLHFYQGAWASIKGGLANMDVLVALGTSTIWGYSTYVWLTHGTHAIHGVYFEASVMVMAFVSLGKYLEERTKKHSLNSVTALMSLVPEQAWVKRGDTWQEVPLSQVQIDDVLLARVGDKIACDGVVVSGAGYVDEAHLTGESRVLTKTLGMTVLAGSTLSDGSLEYRVLATGKDTLLGDMAHALSQAQGTKAKIARLADVVSGVFVPSVVGVSLLTFVVVYFLGLGLDEALLRAVSVLVIACPCALGLATPTAIMAGMGVASRHGVMFKDAISLEQAGKIDTIVFDKTGTLTQGVPTVQDIYHYDKNIAIDEIIRWCASVEIHAGHPLAQALVDFAKQKNVSLLTAHHPTSLIGQGISATIDGIGLVKVGTPKFIGIDDVPTSGVWGRSSLVAVGIDDRPLAVFALADELKTDALAVVQAFKDDGIDVMILSGDHQGVVDDVASRLQVVLAYGQLSPQDKANHIKALQQQGQNVAMIGDGVNDAPAMATANTSFAVEEASAVARQTASAWLVGTALIHAYYAQKIAKITLRTIKQNLFFAFIYNVVGILLAVFGVLNPMIAGLAMALSSISVLMNALRLKKTKLSLSS